MAVYSYTSSATLNIKNGYDGDLLGSYPGYFASTYSEEKISFDYNQNSIVDYDTWDYGSIAEVISEDEDYGEITATIELWYQIQDYGSLEIQTTRRPYGSVNITDFADTSLVRVSVGGVVFALFGRSATQVIFNPVNRVFDIEGTATVRATLASAGNGIVKFARVRSADSVGFNPPESVFLMKFGGKATTEVVFYEGDRVFDIEGTADESITYDYSEESRIDFNSDDYDFITNSPLRQEDYGLITEGEDIERWDLRAENWGLITENATVTPFGLFTFFGGSKESTSEANYTGEGSITISGSGNGRTTPRQITEGGLNITGYSRIQIRMHYKADGGQDLYPQKFRGGSLFGFSSSTESSVFKQTTTDKLFSIQSSTTFSAVRSEVGVSDEDILVRGGAVYSVIFYEGQRAFSLSNIEINNRTYSYNESSIVNVEGIDYGFVNESPSFLDDFGDLGDNPYYPWEVDDYGFLVPNDPLLPYGTAKIISTTEDSQTKIYIGSGRQSINGNAKVYVLPKHNGSGRIRFEGSLVEKNTENYVGSGSLFGYSSTTESTLVAEESKELFRFVGNAVEKVTGGGLIGSGTLFGFNTASVSIIIGVTVGGLFNIEGQAVERNTESYVGSGSLFSISGHAERVTYHYNESSIVDIESDDYGFITEAPVLEQYCNPISSYSSEQISTYASEVVSEFGCVDIDTDYGLVGDQATYSWQTADYGFLIPNEPRRPYGRFRVVSGTTEAYSKGNYTGSGSIFTFVSATESTSNIETSRELFRISGSAIEKNTENYVGEGSLFTFISAVESALFQEETTGLFKINGSAIEKNTENYVGTGTLFGFSSTTEATAVQADVYSLFTITGNAAESTTPATEIGSGSIFSFVSFTESRAISEVSSELFRINGSAYIIPSYAHLGSGTLTVSGEAKIFVLPKHTGRGFIRFHGRGFESTTPATEIGSGSIFSFVSFTETAVYNPLESTLLFRIRGAATNERNTEAYNGLGRLQVSGKATPIFRIRVTQTGKEFIRIRGSAFESTTPATEIGSGSIFSFVSATESTSNAESSKELFRFVGSSIERNTESYLGSGRAQFSNKAGLVFRLRVTETGRQPIDILGSAIEKNTENYIGKGSIFSFVSATESTSNAESSKELFRIVGRGEHKVSFNPPEFGERIKFSGDAIEKNTENYVGTGTLFGFISASESISNAESSKELFRFVGKGDESTTPAPHVGSGSIFTFVSFTETRSVSEVATELFRISGSAIEKNTENYVGTGTLFGFSSTTESAVFNPPDKTLLFKFSGKGEESTTPAPHVGSGSIFTFVSFTETRSVSEVSTELFRFNGSAVEKNAENYVGTGALTTLGSKATTIFSLRVISDGALVRFNGKSTESFGYGLYTGVTQSRLIGASRDRKKPFETRKPPRIYII